jgi:glycosyltransferase involved in cell wall biosynthesis
VAHPVRIAFAITELEFGGAERCLANLVTGIDRSRFDPIVCALKPRPVAGQDLLVRQIEDVAVPVHFLNLRSPASFLSGMTKLKRLLRRHETEVVQTFLFHANVIGAFAAKSAGVPRIFSGVRVADPSRWRMILERFAVRRVDRIVCVSQSVADHTASKLGIAPAKLCVIPNGIDLSKMPEAAPLDKRQFGIEPARKLLLCVGRLHEQKGLDWLLQLAPELFRRLPEHDIVIVGDGPERRSLGEIASRLGIQSRVHFVGWRPDVPQWMQAAEILLLPSRWEGMPNVLIEAMGSGLPVVATAVEGVREVLGPLAAGQAVRSGDDEAFINAVYKIAFDSTLKAKLGEENRARIRTEFSLRAMISNYEKLYRS